MTKLRRSGSVEFRNVSMANVLDVAKALCIACKQKKQRRCLSLFQIKSCPSEEVPFLLSTPRSRMEGSSSALGQDPGHSRSASGASNTSVAGAAAVTSAPSASRSISMNSISSDGSAESHVVEQEDIIVLTHDVKSFKEALGKLRRIFHPERDKNETMRIVSHERLGEVLRILRSIMEKYPPIQSTELLMAAGTLIQQVKSYEYEDEKSDPSSFFDAIDQLALAFSSRVSDYLMGDLDSSSQPVPKTRSCDNLLSTDAESDALVRDKSFASATLTPQEIDARLLRLGDGVDLALRRAKIWSKYAKDTMAYIEKRCSLEAEHARNLVKLAQTMRPILKEESFLPFQSIYCISLDQDYANAQARLSTCSLLQGQKFIEPLTARRNEHEKSRKQIKEIWHRELKRMHEAVTNMRKARAMYHQRHQEYEKAKESAVRAENSESTEASKLDKKRRVEDDACQKAMEAETTYKACVVEANERRLSLDKVKGEVLQQVRELIYQCDQTMKAVTVGYFHLQYTISAEAPVQFQTLCGRSQLYEPGTQYKEFVKRLPQAPGSGTNGTVPFTFEPYSADSRLDKARRSNGSTESGDDVLSHSFLDGRFSADGKEKVRTQQPAKAWSPATQPVVGSDSDSMSSCPSNKSQDTSPAASPHIHTRKVINMSSGDELETDHDNVDNFSQNRRTCMSKAADTHTFRKLKTPSRCRECDSYVYFHGFECLECGLASHKKCLESLAIQCGRKRLPRKMTTFGVDLTTHAIDSGEDVPYIVHKCIAEIEEKGFFMKGIYRVSGVKSKVEKLCQSFENGAELVDLDGIHPNVIANVLKLYLRQLPEPLLTFRLYPDFIKVAKDYPAQKEEGVHSSEKAVEDLQKLVLRLPAVHLASLACLMHHLYRVSEHSDHNNMPPSNLGIVFGPTLLRTSEGSASLSSLVDTVHQTRVIELLITHAFEIFGPPPHFASSLKEVCLRNPQSKSVRQHTGDEKQFLARTVSGASQASDIDDIHRSDGGRDSVLDVDDYPLPGYLATDKSLEMEVSHQGSDITHSSDDLLYSAVTSDDDFPEIQLPDDSVFKKSPLLPRGQIQYSGLRSSDECTRAGQTQNLMKVQDARASLSSSPAVSEASQCSSHIRSTDEDSVHGSDLIWRESLLPVPPPRKNAPSALQLNQSFLHGSLERKQCASSVSESSGISSAASTSPTGIGDTSQSDTGSMYTSTAMVTLAGQKLQSSPSGSRISTSTMTAELRRQFFETATAAQDGIQIAPQRGSVSSQMEPNKSPFKGSSESNLPCTSPTGCFTFPQQRSVSQQIEKENFTNMGGGWESETDFKFIDDCQTPLPESPQVSHSSAFAFSDGKAVHPDSNILLPGTPPSKIKGTNVDLVLSVDPSLNLSMGKVEKAKMAVKDYDSSEQPKKDLYAINRPNEDQSESILNYSSYAVNSAASSSKITSTEKSVHHHHHRFYTIQPGDMEKFELCNNEFGAKLSIDTSDTSSVLQADSTVYPTSHSITASACVVETVASNSSNIVAENQSPDNIVMSEKLSLNRQPRFV